MFVSSSLGTLEIFLIYLLVIFVGGLCASSKDSNESCFDSWRLDCEIVLQQ